MNIQNCLSKENFLSFCQKRYIKKIGFKWKEGVEGYRLRVGNFRVLFDVNGVIIDIIDIGNRGQIYKGV